MTWAQRLLQFTMGTEPGVPEGVADLHRLLADGAHELGRVAALAPNASIEAEIREVAERETGLAERLRDALKAIAVDVPAAARAPAPTPPGQNHWARLVSALEHHRLTRQQFIDTAIVVEDTHPAFAALLEERGRELQPLLEALRDLVARADPQALK